MRTFYSVGLLFTLLKASSLFSFEPEIFLRSPFSDLKIEKTEFEELAKIKTREELIKYLRERKSLAIFRVEVGEKEPRPGKIIREKDLKLTDAEYEELEKFYNPLRSFEGSWGLYIGGVNAKAFFLPKDFPTPEGKNPLPQQAKIFLASDCKPEVLVHEYIHSLQKYAPNKLTLEILNREIPNFKPWQIMQAYTKLEKKFWSGETKPFLEFMNVSVYFRESFAIMEAEAIYFQQQYFELGKEKLDPLAFAKSSILKKNIDELQRIENIYEISQARSILEKKDSLPAELQPLITQFEADAKRIKKLREALQSFGKEKYKTYFEPEMGKRY